MAELLDQPKGLDPATLGQTFTRPEVARAIIEIIGYAASSHVAEQHLCEPAAGEGAILVAALDVLVPVALRAGGNLGELAGCISAYEIDPALCERLWDRVQSQLESHGISRTRAAKLSRAWIHNEDFLLSDRIGADWIVGNPPYVRMRALDPELRETYLNRWGTLTRNSDIYIAFIDAGLDRLAIGGKMAYLCPTNWMRNDFGQNLRSKVVSEYALESIYRVVGARPFVTPVAAYPSVITFGNSTQRDLRVGELHLTTDSGSGSLEALAADLELLSAVEVKRAVGGQYWPHFDGTEEDAPSHFDSITATGVSVRTGIATGCDQVFVAPLDDFEAAGVETKTLLPACHARDLAGFDPDVPANYLLDPARIVWGHEDTMGAEMYLRRNREKLTRRRYEDTGDGSEHWKLIDAVDRVDLTAAKLCIPDIRGHLEVHLVPPGIIPLHGVTYLTSQIWDIEVLGGVLMSTVVERQVSRVSPRLGGGHYRVSSQYIKTIRIPNPTSLSPAHAAKLRLAFRDKDRAASDAVVAALA